MFFERWMFQAPIAAKYKIFNVDRSDTNTENCGKHMGWMVFGARAGCEGTIPEVETPIDWTFQM